MRVETRFTNEYTGETTEKVAHRSEALNEQGYKFMIQNRQCRIFADIDLPPAFTPADVGRIYLLSKHYLEKDTNCLVKRTKRGKTHMAEHDIYKALGLQERQGRELVSKMIKKGVMARMKITSANTEVVQYYINPMYFISGARLSPSLYRLFATWLDPVLPVWAVLQLRTMK